MIGGFPVELVVADDRSDPKESVTLARLPGQVWPLAVKNGVFTLAE